MHQREKSPIGTLQPNGNAQHRVENTTRGNATDRVETNRFSHCRFATNRNAFEQSSFSANHNGREVSTDKYPTNEKRRVIPTTNVVLCLIFCCCCLMHVTLSFYWGFWLDRPFPWTGPAVILLIFSSNDCKKYNRIP